MAHIRREQYSGNVLLVSSEFGDRDEGSKIAVLDHVPNINVTLQSSN